ncbi:hypothetical protein VDGE_30074 [Verticillium dahliae]|uniref:Uncharacterized protein n=1 Tax=Verticillium dahliae TaxID=27337 RepID=A0A444RRB1_VERDA|nr:hypothetical protein VDGE_30074 [Verticillium dahliae]
MGSACSTRLGLPFSPFLFHGGQNPLYGHHLTPSRPLPLPTRVHEQPPQHEGDVKSPEDTTTHRSPGRYIGHPHALPAIKFPRGRKATSGKARYACHQSTRSLPAGNDSGC